MNYHEVKDAVRQFNFKAKTYKKYGRRSLLIGKEGILLLLMVIAGPLVKKGVFVILRAPDVIKAKV